MGLLVLPTVNRQQPQQSAPLDPLWAGRITGGFVGANYNNGKFGQGTFSLVPTAQFTAIATQTVGSEGWAQSSNSATDAGGLATLQIANVSTIRNNFSFVLVARVRSVSGAGVGVRCNSDNIFFRSSASNYSVRVNGVDTAGPAFPLNTWQRYVLTSTPGGIAAYVNGHEILTASASAAATAMGVGIDVWEDSQGGGAMDMDVALCAVMTGISRADARSLSENPWQMFKAAPRRLWATAPTGGASGALATTNANDTISASGTPTVAGALSDTNANDTIAASGSVGGSAITGVLAAINANDTAAGSGTPTILGSVATTNANDTAVINGVSGVVSGAANYINLSDVVQASGSGGILVAPLKVGGDDAPRPGDDERIEIWERPAPTKRRDDSLDKVIREAYAKATGKAPAPVVAKVEAKAAPAVLAPTVEDDEEDDLEILLLSL